MRVIMKKKKMFGITGPGRRIQFIGLVTPLEPLMILLVDVTV